LSTLPSGRIASRAVVRSGSKSLLASVGAVVDPLIVGLSLAGVSWLNDGRVEVKEWVLAGIALALSYPGTVPFVYRPAKMLRQVSGNWSVLCGLMLLFGLLSNTIKMFNPNVLAAWVAAVPVLQSLAHGLSPWLLGRVMALRAQDTAVIIGANELGRTLARSLIEQRQFSPVRVTAFFDDRAPQRLGPNLELPISGGIDTVADFVRANRIDQIYIALPMASQPRILRLLEQLRDTTVSIYFLPDIFLYDLIQARVDTVGGLPVVAVCETPFHGTTGLIKRLSDVCLSTAAIAVTAPLMLGIAVAVRATSPGPILFRQRRYGLDGEEIVVWKFRSMRVQEDGATVRQATRDDDRITPIGGFLRRTSLDELPQFFNVLQGRMSVVGPRPHAVAHNEAYRKLIKGYMIRHKVKPGITGWAQVNGARGETETVDKMKRRIELDLEYLRHWSLRMDVKIVLMTVWQALRGDRNAY
jgi:putative colanic acid biosynthesis UDP-glucose lipid carrier transferase